MQLGGVQQFLFTTPGLVSKKLSLCCILLFQKVPLHWNCSDLFPLLLSSSRECSYIKALISKNCHQSNYAGIYPCLGLEYMTLRKSARAMCHMRSNWEVLKRSSRQARYIMSFVYKYPGVAFTPHTSFCMLFCHYFICTPIFVSMWPVLFLSSLSVYSAMSNACLRTISKSSIKQRHDVLCTDQFCKEWMSLV